jgi:hypothetical protein
MKKPIYREALAHGWRLAWKHSWLWPLGLFAALLGQMGMVDIIMKAVSGVSASPALPGWTALPEYIRVSFFEFRAALPVEGWSWLILLLVILLLFTVVFVFVSIVSQAAIVDIAALATKRKKFPDVSEAWHRGVEHFWPLFFVNLIKKLCIGGTGLLIFLAARGLVADPTAGGALLFVFLFLLALVFGIALSFLLVYAVGYIVVEKYGFFEAIAGAWKLFIEHPLVSLEVGIIILFFNIVLAIAMLFGLIILFVPAFILWFVTLLSGSAAPFVAGFFIGILMSLFFIMFLGAVFAIFTTSTWTYLFMKMHKVGIKSRILHWFR